MKKIFISIVIILFSFQITFAGSLVGTGYGKTEKEAKKEALADLATLIRVEVKSKFFSKTVGNSGGQNKEVKQLVTTESDLPILGVEYDILAASSELMAEAHLKPKNVIRLYNEALKKTSKNINKSLELLDKSTSDTEKYYLLTNLLTYLDKYTKYKAVAILLGVKEVGNLQITETEIRTKLKSLEQSVASIDVGAKVLVKGILAENVFIYPASPEYSHETTPFASILKDKMSQYISTSNSPKSAEYFLRGTYLVLNNSVDVTYHLLNIYGETVSTTVVSFKSQAYKNYRTKPQTIDFDRLLHDGVVVSKDFRVEVATNKGTRNLIFKSKQTIELLVKMNRAGYFYIVGHVTKKAEKYSYLVEFNEGNGNRKFIQRVSADNANKWVSLGEFEAIPPFGVESIQVIASSKDLMSNIPDNKYNKSLELYLLSGNPKKAVVKTRALGKKKSKKTLFAESVMMFTTMK